MRNNWKAQIDQEMDKMIWRPSDTHAVMQQIREEKVMKKKLSLSMAMILILTILAIGAAIAASLGVFGQFAELPYGGAALDELEASATVYQFTQTIQSTSDEQTGQQAQDDYAAIMESQKDRQVSVTLDQGYFDGNQVAISYTIHEPALADIQRGKGMPTGDIPWAVEVEGALYTDDMWPPDALSDKLIAYLNSQEPVFIVVNTVSLGDGLFLADGTPLTNVTSDEMKNSDGDLQGYKTYQDVPEAYQTAESIDVYCNVHITSRLIYQDAQGYKEAWIYRADQQEPTIFAFTLKRNGSTRNRAGAVETALYSASAEVTLSQIGADVSIAIECPETWVQAQTGEGDITPGMDYLAYYQLYADDVRCSGTAGAVYTEDANHMVFMDSYTLPDTYTTLVLVPVYYEAREQWDEAITLR